MSNVDIHNLKCHLAALVSLQTTHGNAGTIDRGFSYLIQELSWYPFHVKTYVHNQVKSVVWSTKRGLKHQFILCAHLDVVPGKPGQFKLKEKNGKWLGRGVMDMKFALAVYLVALKTIYRQTGKLPPLALMVTSDEEVGGGNGVNYLVNTLGYRADAVLIPDGGPNWHLVKESKGVLHLTVTAGGKSCHASTPWSGLSAVDRLLALLTKLRTHYPESRIPTGKTTLVIGTIHGGQQTNQVAGTAEATLDFRYPPTVNPRTIIDQVVKIFGHTGVKVTVTADPFAADTKSPHFKRWLNLLRSHRQRDILISEHGASDGRYFSAKKIPVIISQPVGGNTHGDKEYLNIRSVVEYTELLIRWLSGRDLENIST